MRHSTAFSTAAVVFLLLSSLAVFPAVSMAAPASDTAATAVEDTDKSHIVPYMVNVRFSFDAVPLQVGGGTVDGSGNESGGDGGGEAGGSSSEGEPSARLQSAIDSANADAGGSGNESSGNESGGSDNSTATDRRADSQGVDNTDRADSEDVDGPLDVGSRVTAITDALVAATITEVKRILADLLDTLNWLLFRLPAPGDPYDPRTWITADNGWWPEFMMFYGAMSGGSLGFLILSFSKAVAGRDTPESREQIRKCGKAFVHIVTGPFTMAAFLHLFNGINMGLAVSGSEMLSTPGNAAQLGIVATLFLLLLKFYALAVGAAIVVQIAQFVLTHVAYSLWPVAWTFRATPSAPFQAFGEFGTNALPLLMGLNFVQVLVLRQLFIIDWSAHGWSAVIVGMLGTAVMVALILVYTPIMVANQQWEAVGVSMASRQAKDAGSSAADYAETKISNIRARFSNSARGSSDVSVQPGATTNRLSGTPTGSGSGSGGSSRSSSRSSSSSSSGSTPSSSSSSSRSKPDRNKVDRRRRDV